MRDNAAGHEAIEYFGGLPLQAHGMQPAEPLQEGNNEAEWIVDLTTRADREGRRACTAPLSRGRLLGAWLGTCSGHCAAWRPVRGSSRREAS